MAGNLLFHADIARDFVFMQHVRDVQQLTLIGPRTGGIQGVFHGPLWIYLNMPMFLLGGGNPVWVSVGWWLFYVFSIWSVYWIAKNMYDKNLAIFATVLYTACALTDVHGMNNPAGAGMVFPWFFYNFYLFLKFKKLKNLWWTVFLGGVMVQFQMAFALPILIITSLLIIYFVLKEHKPEYLLSFLVLLLPLASFILFELRHDWFQVHSIINFMREGSRQGFPIWARLSSRTSEMLLNGLSGLVNIWWLHGLLVAVMVAGLFVKNLRKDLGYKLFMYLYLGYWVVIIPFKGQITSLYFFPFLPVACITVTSFLLGKKVRVAKLFWLVLLVLLLKDKWVGVYKFDNINLEKQMWANWVSVSNGAKEAGKMCGEDFGYYVYTPDLFGYELNFAMSYENKRASFNTKKETTCLILAPSSPDHPYDSYNWISGDVRILSKPVKTKTLTSGIQIQKFALSEEEMAVSHNPDMTSGVFIR